MKIFQIDEELKGIRFESGEEIEFMQNGDIFVVGSGGGFQARWDEMSRDEFNEFVKNHENPKKLRSENHSQLLRQCGYKRI